MLSANVQAEPTVRLVEVEPTIVTTEKVREFLAYDQNGQLVAVIRQHSGPDPEVQP